MRWSQTFIPTTRESPSGTEAVSHQLLLRGGFVHMLTAGVYSYLPLGYRVLKNIEAIIRDEMDKAGGAELFLPCLHPLDLWKRTGRDQTLKDVMIRFEDSKNRPMCLGPTHEEVITDLVQNHVQSYRQLPVTLYQIQTKFRDEMRPRYGIVRACEFIMKDAYSFDRDVEGLRRNYEKMHTAYVNIFKRMDLDTVILEADSGAMGGDVSHEFMVPADIGEDAIGICSSCGHRGALREDDTTCPACGSDTYSRQMAIELGHIFQLGTKYSDALQACFLDEDGQRKPIIMGCYGIGVSRVIAALIERHHDGKGMIWPDEVAPYRVEIVALPAKSGAEEMLAFAERLHDDLSAHNISVLLDDRDESPGRKFNDADLIGIPLRVTVGQRNFSQGKVEIKRRGEETASVVDCGNLSAVLEGMLRQ